MTEPDHPNQVAEVSLEDVARALAVLLATNTNDELEAVLKQYEPLLLTDSANQMLATKIVEQEDASNADPSVVIDKLRRVRNLLNRMRTFQEYAREEDMPATEVERGSAQSAEPAVDTQLSSADLSQLLMMWWQIGPFDEWRRFIETHLELFHPECYSILHNIVQNIPEGQNNLPENDKKVIEKRLYIICDAYNRGCTINAIHEAYINIESGFVLDLPDWLKKTICQVESISESGLSTANTRRKLLQKALSRAQKAALKAEIQAELCSQLADTLVEMSETSPGILEKAIKLYDHALHIYTLARYPFQYAGIKCEMGLAYTQSKGSKQGAYYELAIACYEEALSVLTREDFPRQWATLQRNLAFAYSNRVKGNLSDNLHKAINYLEATLLVHTRETAPESWAMAQASLGFMLASHILGSLQENRERTIACYEAALEVYTLEAFPKKWAALQANLGKLYQQRVAGVKSGNIAKAIQHSEAALQVYTQESFPTEWASVHANLDLAYSSHAVMGQSDTSDQTFEELNSTVTHIPANSATLPNILGQLAQSLYIRWLQKGLAMLGTLLSTHYERTMRLEDIERSIEIYHKMLLHLQPDSPYLSVIVAFLSHALVYRCNHVSDGQADIEEAIDICRLALAFPRNDWYPQLLRSLGISLINRCQYTGRVEDAEEAIKLHQEAVNSLPPNSSEVFVYLTGLSSAWIMRYAHTGQLQDLECSIDVLQDISQRIHAPGSDILIGLAIALGMYYNVTGSLAHLEQAIIASRALVQREPPNTSRLAIYLSLHAAMLGTSYKQTGKKEELEEMLTTWQRAAALAPADALSSRMLSHVGSMSLFSHYERTGRLEDLDLAIDHCQQALLLTKADSLAFPELLSNLSACLLDRYDYTKQAEDLEQAIATSEQAVQAALPNHPSRYELLNTLTNALLARDYLTSQEDLARAIEILQSILQATSVDSSMWAGASGNLGIAFLFLYDRTGELADLEQAITSCRDSLQRTSDGSPDRPDRLGNLASSLQALYKRTGQIEDRQQAIVFYEEACQQGLELSLECVLLSSRKWGGWAIEREAWDEAVHAYSFGIQALGLLYHEQLLRSNQEMRLKDAITLYQDAAYAQARAGQLRAAVISLELGHARSLSEGLARDSLDLERLQREAQPLYNNYIAQVRRLQQLEHAELTLDLQALADQVTVTPVSFAAQVRLAREALEKTIAAIRHVSGYADFLAEPTYQSISAAAQQAMPLLYLTSAHGTVTALLVTTLRDEPEVFWAEGEVFDDLLPWLPCLGVDLMQQVAQRLRELKATGVVLIPTGLLGPLPFHVTPYWLEKREVCLLDEFEVAYAHSVRVLNAVRYELQTRRKRAHDSLPQLVGVGNPLLGVEVMSARSELQRIFPSLQQHVTEHLAYFPRETLREHLLVFFREKALQEIQAFCEEQPESLVEPEERLRWVEILLTSFPDLADDVKATLRRVSEHLLPSLTFAQIELESIQTLFSSGKAVTLYGLEATKDVLWEALPRTNIVHFSCHSSFNGASPLDSALLLAGGTRLTLRDLLNTDGERLACMQLAVLSACETAMQDISTLHNEAVSMLSGFLRVGVPAVIGTLWPVDQVSTALLIVRFYELYLYGDTQLALLPQQPLKALRWAQLWLRDLSNNALLTHLQEQRRLLRYHLPVRLLPHVRREIQLGKGEERPYKHPDHWAAFVYYGAW
jgi:tetratricopeptide (TPR) repeat protein